MSPRVGAAILASSPCLKLGSPNSSPVLPALTSSAEMGRGPLPHSGERSLKDAGLGDGVPVHLLFTLQWVFGPRPLAESGAEAEGGQDTGAGQQHGAAAGRAAAGELPAHPGPRPPAAGQTAEGTRPQVAVEAHVDPGVAAAAEVAQKHGDGERHIG